ncbi:EAL domain-containing protein [Shewanella sp. OMA3-2]|uniref:EAL domain-containing protein n=1 Tax=Shewanella sp. OMA3-2 TaxID=2908650 RepID=UPI001F19EE60|nr:EAL domain-containing protein [Shewanella sp. OMA3-2]UJF21375.1 EAL domain-containing protein [Shewanella sp. OMA3-2]
MSLIAHYLHKWKFRLAILIGLLLLWPLQNAFISTLQSDALKPYHIQLPVNLDSATRDKWGINQDAVIEKVFVSGSFSDWHIDDTFYQLTQQDGHWQFDLPIYPGELEYKLVLFIQNQVEPVWILDPNNPDITVNPWEGSNSVLHIADWPKVSLISQILTAALLGTFLLFCILEPFLYWLLHQKLPFHRKLVLSNILILACTQIIFLSYQLHLNRQLIKQGLIDSVHGMHLIFHGEGVDFEHLNTQTDNINHALTKFFLPATTRIDKTQSSLFQITLSDFAVLNENGQLITLRHREQNQHIQQSRAEQLGFNNSQDYFINGMWQHLLPNAITNALNGQIVIASRPHNMRKVETSRTQSAELILGFSQFVQPIVSRGQLKGFYAGSVQVKLYGDELLRILVFQLLLLVGVIVLSSWLFTRVGKMVTEDILKLTQWTQNIVKGNLSQILTINSQDEIQQLSENFNKMRQSLQDSFAQIAVQNNKLYQEAYFNGLTALPNRKKLHSDLAELAIGALLVININDFGEFNDFYGVDAGDEILLEVANRLASGNRPVTLYKTGPDEFVVTLTTQVLTSTSISDSLSSSAVTTVASSNNQQLAKLAQLLFDDICQKPLLIKGSEYYICVSIGGALLANEQTLVTEESGLSVEHSPATKSANQLHRHADLARRFAKKQQLFYCCFSTEMANSAAFEENMRQSRMLAKAAQENWVVPYVQLIQPLIDAPIKFECLMRLQLPDGQILAPHQFMKAARQSRIYPQLMRCMLQKSIALFKDQPYDFSVNITLDDIAITQNLEIIISLLKTDPNTCQRITFELLESEEITNYEAVEHFIKLVKPLGCKIAIDDFGAGYSNFVHLLSLDIDIIKIDGSLIRHLDNDPKARLLVETIAIFAHKMGKKTVAEFVENDATLNLLNQYEIDYAQGYLLGKPAPTITQALAIYSTK